MIDAIIEIAPNTRGYITAFGDVGKVRIPSNIVAIEVTA